MWLAWACGLRHQGHPHISHNTAMRGRIGRGNYQIKWGRTFLEEQDVTNGLLVEVNALARLVVRHFGSSEAVKS